jgi:hypothetical protein
MKILQNPWLFRGHLFVLYTKPKRNFIEYSKNSFKSIWIEIIKSSINVMFDTSKTGFYQHRWWWESSKNTPHSSRNKPHPVMENQHQPITIIIIAKLNSGLSGYWCVSLLPIADHFLTKLFNINVVKVYRMFTDRKGGKTLHSPSLHPWILINLKINCMWKKDIGIHAYCISCKDQEAVDNVSWGRCVQYTQSNSTYCE